MEKGSWDSKEDLVKKLCEDACKFLGEEARKEGVDPNTPLIDLGMDSMSLAQFKGLLHAKVTIVSFTRTVNNSIRFKLFPTFF